MSLIRNLFSILLFPAIVQAQTITTYAGTGFVEFKGDGGPATKAGLSQPVGLATDKNGCLYIADGGHSIVRKITPDGTITTIIGHYEEERVHPARGFEGDEGPATDAVLWKTRSVLVESGNVYIGDFENSVIRKVNSAGIIRTIAGFPRQLSPEDNQPVKQANSGHSNGGPDGTIQLYFADDRNNTVHCIAGNEKTVVAAGNGNAGYSGDGGPAKLAQINRPWSVAADDAGNLFIADTYNNAIRKVNAEGIISTYAGNGKPAYNGDGGPATLASINSPRGIAADGEGNLYITDVVDNVVRMIDAHGVISTVAGNGMKGYKGDNGPATDAQLNLPTDVAVDAAGNLYIADASNHVVRKVAPAPRSARVAPAKDAFGIAADPGSNELIITTDSAAFASFTITGTSGKILLRSSLNAVNTRVDISMLPPARYFINLKKEDKVKTAMFVKDK